jgi:hypothetical protein
VRTRTHATASALERGTPAVELQHDRASRDRCDAAPRPSRAAISGAHLRYLLLEHVLGAAAVNFALNAGIAWVTFRRAARVPFWGHLSIAGDTAATSLVLPFMTCLTVTLFVRRDVRAGRVPALGWTRSARRAVGWLPRRTLLRALVLGLLFGALLAPPTIAAVGVAHVAPLPLCPFVAFKAAFAAIEAALVSPLVALWALASAPPAQAARLSVAPAAS